MGFPGWAGLINSTQKIRVLVNSAGVIFKCHMRGRHWEAGETVDHKGYWESHIRNLILFVTLWAVTEDMRLHEGVPVSLRPPAGH